MILFMSWKEPKLFEPQKRLKYSDYIILSKLILE